MFFFKLKQFLQNDVPFYGSCCSKCLAGFEPVELVSKNVYKLIEYYGIASSKNEAVNKSEISEWYNFKKFIGIYNTIFNQEESRKN